MRAPDHSANRTRRTSPGTAAGLLACAAATLLVFAVAIVSRPAAAPPVEHGLPDARVLATPDFDGQATLGPRDWLQRFYRTGDARYLQYAEATLTAGDDIVRARLADATHQFLSAARLAGKIIESKPRHAEARLLRADAFRRAGNLAAARRDCLALALIGNADAGDWCGVQVLLSEGRALEAHERAQQLSGSSIGMATAMQRWSAEVAAEAAAHAGFHDRAAAIYRQLVDTGESSFSARLAYADLLLQQQQADAVMQLLSGDFGRVAAQVRLAIAMKARGDRPDRQLAAAINAAFDGMSADSVADVRLRDRAFFELRYNEDPQLALRYALANWEQQKGPEDLSLLYDAASASNDSDALAAVARWKSQAASGRGS